MDGSIFATPDGSSGQRSGYSYSAGCKGTVTGFASRTRTLSARLLYSGGGAKGGTAIGGQALQVQTGQLPQGKAGSRRGREPTERSVWARKISLAVLPLESCGMVRWRSSWGTASGSSRYARVAGGSHD